MVQWLNTLLHTAQGPGQGQREHNPPNSEKPPEERRGHQPQERPEDHHGGGSGYQNEDQGWSDQWARGEAAGTQANAHGPAGQRDGDPKRQWETQGPQGGPGHAGDPMPADPWAAYKKAQDGHLPAQQSGWGSQHWQSKENPQDEQYPVRQPGRRAPPWEKLWWEEQSHKEMRFGDWRCGNGPACKYPNFAYRDFCKQCKAPKADAKWELPQDPRLARCECGASIKPHYTGNCRACQAPITRPDGGATVYNPQGDRPLSAPIRGGNLQSHPAEHIMLWLEAVLNPAGPPTSSATGQHAPTWTTSSPATGRFRVPYTGSTQVAKAWEVDHNTLCGKLLGHRRRKSAHANPPRSFTSGAWDPRSKRH